LKQNNILKMLVFLQVWSVILCWWLELLLLSWYFLAPKYGNRTALVYITICSTLRSFTVMGCKGVGVAYQQTIHGHSQLKNWMTYACVAVLVICIFVQMNFLNRALDVYNTAVVTPIYYVFFTTCVIVGSIVYFKNFLQCRKKKFLDL
jgi:hypothetical protein